MIPPSILLIVYGAMAGLSVVQLYAAALFPGFVLAAMYVAFVVILAVVKPSLAPPLSKEQANVPVAKVMLMLVTSFVPLAVMILCVLGAIMFGLATPTEAASVGALGSALLAMAYRAFTWARLKEAVYLTARTSAMVCFLFVGSATFAGVFSYLGGEGIIKTFVLGLDLNPVMFLVISQLIIFLLGWPLEWTEIIIIFVPIFLPLLSHFNVDPLLFGILVALNLQTAFLSPPMAMAAYYLKGISPPQVLLTQIFWGCLPFLFIVIVSMLVIYIWPQISLWLPRAIYGN
jgi:tripartite ATP-independent transporter DctM subunit